MSCDIYFFNRQHSLLCCSKRTIEHCAVSWCVQALRPRPSSNNFSTRRKIHQGLVGDFWGTISVDAGKMSHVRTEEVNVNFDKYGNTKCVFVHAFGHAHGCAVMLGDAQTIRLKSHTVIERVWATLMDRCVELHLPPRQLFHSSFVRCYLQKVANSRRQCASAGTEHVFIFSTQLQKVIILPRLTATSGSLNGRHLKKLRPFLPWGSDVTVAVLTLRHSKVQSRHFLE